MRAGQRLTNSRGNEILLFPLEYLYLTEGRVPPEHDVLALDFLGWGSSGRVYDCNCYAPFSCSVVYTGNDHNMIIWSDNPVVFADGTIDYASILVAHSNTEPANVGTHFTQGDLFYHTGNYGFSGGDHLHIELAKGHNTWNDTYIGLKNAIHFYDGVYVNDTEIVRGGEFTWKTYKRPIITKTNKYNVLLYTFNNTKRKVVDKYV